MAATMEANRKHHLDLQNYGSTHKQVALLVRGRNK